MLCLISTIYYKIFHPAYFDNCPKFNYNQGRSPYRSLHRKLLGLKIGNMKKFGGLKMSTTQMISYRILLKKEPEGGYTVTVPSLPGCVTYGKSIEEATEMAKEAIELYLESLKSHHEEIPNDEGTLEYTLMVEMNA
jgi:predicted RNase H-like HicB family nuclease